MEVNQVTGFVLLSALLSSINALINPAFMCVSLQCVNMLFSGKMLKFQLDIFFFSENVCKKTALGYNGVLI